jgi:hypothetical protein
VRATCNSRSFVVPAKAGTRWRVPVARSSERRWVPASAGTPERAFGQKTLGSRLRGNDGAHVRAKDARSKASSSPRRRGPSGVFQARSSERRWVPASAGTTERTFGERRWVESFVVPAKAGTQWRVPVARSGERRWVPASAGTTERTFGRKTLGRKLRRPREGGDPVACSSGAFGRKTLGSRFRGNDGARVRAKDARFPLPRERRCPRNAAGSSSRGSTGW